MHLIVLSYRLHSLVGGFNQSSMRISFNILNFIFGLFDFCILRTIVKISLYWQCFNLILISSIDYAFQHCYVNELHFNYCLSYSYVKISTQHGPGSSRKMDTKTCLWSARQRSLKWVRRIASPFTLPHWEKIQNSTTVLQDPVTNTTHTVTCNKSAGICSNI